MGSGPGSSYDVIYSFKKRMRDGGKGGGGYGCILPLLIIGVCSVIGFIVRDESINPVLWVIPGICFLIVLLILVIPILRKK